MYNYPSMILFGRGVIMYIMKDEYKVGIEFIDEQHARLFELANETYNLLNDNLRTDKYDKIVDLITELKEYAIFHFKAEEEYMKSIQYKKMFTQKIEHQEYIKKFDDLDLNHIDENQDKYILELLNFLNNWLVEHILEKDMLIGK